MNQAFFRMIVGPPARHPGNTLARPLVRPVAGLLLLLLSALLAGCVTLASDGNANTRSGSDGSGAEGESTVASGLREALSVGTRRAVERTSKVDGYLANELIRIGLPPELESVTGRMRQLGLGGQVDNLEKAMNRAAEQAASEATSIFAGAIRNMRPADVYAVLNGGQDAATGYLRSQSEAALRERYGPVVRRQLNSVDAYGYYQTIANTWNALPLVQPLDVDLEDHVTDQALAGLFTVLAEEEARIRQDPVARSTDLLRRVFGNGS